MCSKKEKKNVFLSLANFFFFLFFPSPLEISQSRSKNVQIYSKTKFQQFHVTIIQPYPIASPPSSSKKKKKKGKKKEFQDEQLIMEVGWFKVYMARVDSNVNPLDLGATESHSPAACSCIEPSGPRARSSPNVKVAARSVTERPGPVLFYRARPSFRPFPHPSHSPPSLFSSLLATIRFFGRFFVLA